MQPGSAAGTPAAWVQPGKQQRLTLNHGLVAGAGHHLEGEVGHVVLREVGKKNKGASEDDNWKRGQ